MVQGNAATAEPRNASGRSRAAWPRRTPSRSFSCHSCRARRLADPGRHAAAAAGAARHRRRPRRRRRPSCRRRIQAARFLDQASMGASKADVDAVAAQGYAAWLDAQFAMPRATSHWDWLVAARLRDQQLDEQPGRLRSGDVAPAHRKRRPAAPARRHGSARFPRRRHRRGQPALAAVRGRRLCRRADGRRLRQFPHPAAEHLAQRRDGLLSDLRRQPEGQSGDRRRARRELCARADAALHHRPATS